MSPFIPGVTIMAMIGLAHGLWDSDHPSSGPVIMESKLGISYWFGVVFSRGIYVVLGSLILLCMGITGLKNKLEDSMEKNVSTWSLQMLPSTQEEAINETEQEEDTGLKDRLIEAELTVISLQKDLETARRAQEEMEERLSAKEESGLLTNEVMSFGEFSKTSVSTFCLSDQQAFEKIRKENALIAKNLQRALSDKARLEEEMESIKRESRIVKSAMKDHQSMAYELEDLRQNLKSLKEENESLKKDKDVAASILADILKSAYAHPMCDNNANEIIVSIPPQLESIINRILVRKEIDRKDNKKIGAPSGDEGSVEENVRLPGWTPEVLDSQSDDSVNWGQDEGSIEEPSLVNYLPSNEVTDQEDRELSVKSSYSEAVEESTHFLDAEEVCEGIAEIFQHPVTGSVAFQQFLQKNF